MILVLSGVYDEVFNNLFVLIVCEIFFNFMILCWKMFYKKLIVVIIMGRLVIWYFLS